MAASPNSVSPSSTRLTAISVAVILSCAMYRPLEFWGRNAWDLSSPITLLAIGGLVFLVGLAIWFGLVRIGLDSLLAALVVGALEMIFFYWERLVPNPLIWVLSLVLLPVMLMRVLPSRWFRFLGPLVILLVGVAPFLNLILQHVQQATPYPTVEMVEPGTVTATGMAEDVVLVIVDSYPSPLIAEAWFDHDTSTLLHSFKSEGFQVENSALSRHTFTSLAVPAMLDLHIVVHAGPTPEWGNLTSLTDRLRGDNVTRHSLESAGFRYIHIEGGWDSSSCGAQVENCIEAPFPNEIVWNLMYRSAIGRYLANKYGAYSNGGTLNATEELVHLLETVQDDGQHDFIFTHLFLPHPPIIVDEQCELRPGREYGKAALRVGADALYDTAFSGQLGCTDRLLAEIAGAVGPSTAILITADHGSSLLNQVFKPAAQWTDEEIGERMSILLAYKFPDGCDEPVDRTNLDAMRALVSCAVDIDLPPRDTGFMVGATNPEWVDSARMASIRARLDSGIFPMPEDS